MGDLYNVSSVSNVFVADEPLYLNKDILKVFWASGLYAGSGGWILGYSS